MYPPPHSPYAIHALNICQPPEPSDPLLPLLHALPGLAPPPPHTYTHPTPRMAHPLRKHVEHLPAPPNAMEQRQQHPGLAGLWQRLPPAHAAAPLQQVPPRGGQGQGAAQQGINTRQAAVSAQGELCQEAQGRGNPYQLFSVDGRVVRKLARVAVEWRSWEGLSGKPPLAKHV
jgi:hypothetical protein